METCRVIAATVESWWGHPACIEQKHDGAGLFDVVYCDSRWTACLQAVRRIRNGVVLSSIRRSPTLGSAALQRGDVTPAYPTQADRERDYQQRIDNQRDVASATIRAQITGTSQTQARNSAAPHLFANYIDAPAYSMLTRNLRPLILPARSCASAWLPWVRAMAT